MKKEVSVLKRMQFSEGSHIGKTFWNIDLNWAVGMQVPAFRNLLDHGIKLMLVICPSSSRSYFFVLLFFLLASQSFVRRYSRSEIDWYFQDVKILTTSYSGDLKLWDQNLVSSSSKDISGQNLSDISSSSNILASC